MPDLINEGEGGHKPWADELCASCLACSQDGCKLVAALYAYKIITFSGCRIFACEHYQADPESEHYIHPHEDRSVREAEQSLKAALQELQSVIPKV